MNPITATATRPEPTPEPVRPRLYLAIFQDNRGYWDKAYLHGAEDYAKLNCPDGGRVITIPTDAEAAAYGAYVKALEDEVEAWRAAYTVWNQAGGHTDRPVTMHDCWAERVETESARAAWEAERGKA